MGVATAKHVAVNIGGTRHDVIRAAFGERGFRRHFHETYSIGVMRRGVNVFALGRRLVEVNVGAVSIVNPGEVHDGGRTGAPWAYDCVFPSQELMSEIAPACGVAGHPVFSAACIQDPLCSAKLERFFDVVFDDAAEPALIEEAAIDAFGALMTRHADGCDAGAATRSSIAEAAIKLLDDAGPRPISLATMARELGVNQFKIIRAVSAATGLTPHAYLLQARVNRAARFIQSGASIADAASAFGFADQSHLTREMRRRWGVTPRALQAGARR